MDKNIEYFEPFFEDKDLLKSLDNLRTQSKNYLNNLLLVHYTDHSIDHSDRVLKILIKL